MTKYILVILLMLFFQETFSQTGEVPKNISNSVNNSGFRSDNNLFNKNVNENSSYTEKKDNSFENNSELLNNLYQQIEVQKTEIGKKNTYLTILSVILVLVLFFMAIRQLFFLGTGANFLPTKKKVKQENEKKKEFYEKKISENLVIETDTEDLKLFNKLVSILENKHLYLNDSISLTSLAVKLGISANKLSNVINNCSNKGYSDFINEYRINYAQRLLSISEFDNLNIAQIAEKSGFRSTTTFNVAFKKHSGVTPTFFKKNAGNTNL